MIVLLGCSKAELGGSQLQKLVEGSLGTPPPLDLIMKNACSRLCRPLKVDCFVLLMICLTVA